MRAWFGLLAAASILLTSGGWGIVRADGLRLFLEHEYTLGEIRTREADGIAREMETHGFRQAYRLAVDRRLFPHLTLRGGGLFEKNETSMAGDLETETERTEISPFVDLTLSTPLYSAAAGYSRRQTRQEGSGTAPFTLIRDTYSSALGWHPAGLPAFTLQFTQSDTYDRSRNQQDDSSRRLLFGAEYRPAKEWSLNYQGILSRTDDRLNQLEATEQSHSGRITYAERFWGDRISLLGTYTAATRRIDTVASGGGEVETPLAALSGLGALDRTPEEGELAPATALVDANLTASAGFNLGHASGGGEGSALRNLGLELFDAEVSAFYVSVDRELPAAVAASFLWEVFTSPNGLDWTPVQTVAGAPFGPFLNRFEIRFLPVRARYVKVTVAPLSLDVFGAHDFPDIFVTELQAVRFEAAAAAEGTNTMTSHQVSLAAKTRLLEHRPLFYDFSLLYSTSDQGSRLFLANGLSLQHTFTPWLSGTAQVGRDDTRDRNGDTVSYRYGFSATAVPLRPLSHTLSYSGRFEQGPYEARRDSVFLNNRATLYPGVDVLLNGGLTFGSLDTGEETRGTLFSLSAVLTPHRIMVWNLSYSEDRSERSGGGRPQADSLIRRGRLSLSCTPAPAVSLYLALEAVEQDSDLRTLQNYAAHWSPLRDGALQFSVAFNESLRPEDNALERLIVPSARWEIRPGTVLELSYSLVDSESDLRSFESRYFNALLRTSF